MDEAWTDPIRQQVYAERFALPAIKAEPLPHQKGCCAFQLGFPVPDRNDAAHAGIGATPDRRGDCSNRAPSRETSSAASAAPAIAGAAGRAATSVDVPAPCGATAKAAEAFQAVLIVQRWTTSALTDTKGFAVR